MPETDWSDHLQTKNAQCPQQSQKPEAARKDCPTGVRRSMALLHLDFGLLDFRGGECWGQSHL